MTDGVIAWRALAAHFRERILSGELKPGERLPSGERIRQEFEVSQTTNRRAMNQLSHEGLVEIRAPFGVFVAAPAGDLVLGSGDSAKCDGAVIVTRADGTVETRPIGTRIVIGA
jgi:DNA-binding GntR family transcriptional regulator